MTETKKYNSAVLNGIITIVFAILGLVFFRLSYTTGYYTFGQMNSKLVMILAAAAIVVELVYIILQKKVRETVFAPFFNWAVIAMLMAAALLLIGDRVEGIGNCIVTDYDSGHGGEEAIYMSIAGALLFIIGAIFAIAATFKKLTEKKHVVGKVIKSVVALVIAGAVCFEGLSLGGLIKGGGIGGSSGTEYTVSYNQQNNNTDDMPDYQFLCCNFAGMVRADSRFYVDVTLTLKDDGTYELFTDSYVIEAGNRAEVGDDTGLGLVLTTQAEGTYVDNGDGTVTTSAATHAVFEMETDTYSSQMKSAAGMFVGESDEDGIYDSNDYPVVLDFVPESTFVLGDGTIESYSKSGGNAYTISYNQQNGNSEEGVMPDYQFLCCNFAGMVRADSRFYVDLSLALADDGTYTLNADSYVIEAGERCEVGDDTGLGLVLTTEATGTYTDNGDGTVTIDAAEHAVFEMETDTYSSQMKSAAGMFVGESDEDGVYDSDEYPVVLSFVPSTTFTLADGAIVTYEKAGDTYSVSFNQNNGNTEDMPENQFLCCNFAGMVKADARFYVDVKLSLKPDGTYKLNTDSYVIEAGERAVVGDDTGLGLVLTMDAEGTYTDNGNGTVTINKADTAVFEMETDTYSSQMKSAAGMEVDGNDADGIYTSDEYPAVLDFVPTTTITLNEDGTMSW